MKWFNVSEIRTLDDLKKAYRQLSKAHHPDLGGSTQDMQEINNEYQALFDSLKSEHNARVDATGKGHKTEETAADFIRIIEILIKLDGLDIELCGSWLWIGGNTRKHKEALKAAGCQWCSKKKLWSWKPAGKRYHSYRGTKSMAEIRTKYGSQTFTRKADEMRTA